MGWNFRRSTKIAPGVRLNFSKKGVGVSLGPRGSKISISPGKRITSNIGIPGTGLRYTTVITPKSRRRTTAGNSPSNTPNILPDYQRPVRKQKTIRPRIPVSTIIFGLLAVGLANGIFTSSSGFSSSTTPESNTVQTRFFSFLLTASSAGFAFWRYRRRQKNNTFWRERESGYQNPEVENPDS